MDDARIAGSDTLRRADYVATGQLDNERLVLLPLARATTDIATDWLVLDAFYLSLALPAIRHR